MSANTPANQVNPNANEVGGGSRARVILRAAIMLFLPAVILFAAAGRLDWGMGWAYVIVATALAILSRLIVFRINPDLIAERAHALEKEDTKSWDKTLVPLAAVYGPMVMLLVAGLDERNSWSPEISPGIQAAALAVVTAGYLVSVWAMAVNRFYSATVRIQKDRGHTVVSSGPYRFVRHPSYAAGIVADFAIPVALGSLWALVVSAVIAVLLVVRTALEDRTLHEELAGYKDYAARVRYRLLPGRSPCWAATPSARRFSRSRSTRRRRTRSSTTWPTP